MKTLLAAGCLISVFVAGCSAESTTDDAASTESELGSVLGADDAIRCSVESQDTKLAIVRTKNGKTALLSLEPAGDLYALSRTASSSLSLRANLKGKWKHGSKTSDVECAKVPSGEATSWRTANALVDYASEIDGIAETVVDVSSDPMPKDYTVFVVETSKRGSLALGTVVSGSAGSLKASTDDSTLDENDFGYGGMSAAYSLGGGDDYGEWFQGASDGVSLIGDVTPALGSNGVAGFIAHEKVSALSSLCNGKDPSAVEITVGPWTFFLPDAFPK